MYGISPDDRLWLIERDQEERRALASADRSRSSIAAGRRDRRSEMPAVGISLLRRSWIAASRALHALMGVRAATHGRAVR